jgi:hypothetical protein
MWWTNEPARKGEGEKKKKKKEKGKERKEEEEEKIVLLLSLFMHSDRNVWCHAHENGRCLDVKDLPISQLHVGVQLSVWKTSIEIMSIMTMEQKRGRTHSRNGGITTSKMACGLRPTAGVFTTTAAPSSVAV